MLRGDVDVHVVVWISAWERWKANRRATSFQEPGRIGERGLRERERGGMTFIYRATGAWKSSMKRESVTGM